MNPVDESRACVEGLAKCLNGAKMPLKKDQQMIMLGWLAVWVQSLAGRVVAEHTDQVMERMAQRMAAHSAAATIGSKGGRARAKALAPERRTEIARNAAHKRWTTPK